MRADDLTSILAPAGAPDVGFHQGTVIAWNASTGANTISVNGATLTDVPILNTGEAIALKAGHVVGLLRFKSTYFILGRITIPGGADFAAASVAFDGAGATATNYGLTTTFTNKVTGTLDVPSWADEAIVLCTVNATAFNPTASNDTIRLKASIAGVAGGEAYKDVSATGFSNTEMGTVSASAQRQISSPGATISVAASMAAFATWAADSQNIVNVDAIAVYRSIT